VVQKKIQTFTNIEFKIKFIMINDTLSFLSALKENNNREWFDMNRDWYQQAKKNFENFVSKLIPEVHAIDHEIGVPEVKDCTFRIFRDIRFSNDKTPYKTNMGAFLAKGGRKSQFGGYYFHLEPGSSMLAGGIWMPEADTLKAIRSEIYNEIDEFKSIILSPTFKKQFVTFDSEGVMLRSAPKDFPKEFPDIELLKFKSYTVSKAIDETLVEDEQKLLKVCLEVFKALKPVNTFFNRAIQEMGN
jgi:uncharacterized protein (TIGR02453 family)